MKLTQKQIEHLTYKPLVSSGSGALLPNRVLDEDGMYLAILPGGGKSFRYDFRLGKNHAGKPSRYVIVYGSFPDTSLQGARELHTDARRLIAKGEIPAVLNGRIVPRKEKQRAGQHSTDKRFKTVGKEWYEAELKAGAKSESWKANYSRWLGWACEEFGERPLPEIEPADVLSLLRKIEARGHAKSAEELRRVISRVFNHGIVSLRATVNPAEPLKRVIKVPDAVHHPKLEAAELPAFLKAIDTHPQENMRLALKILIHCFTRKQELCETPWTEIDLEEALWHIPEARMKKKRDHKIPLSPPVVAMFRRLKELAEGSPYVLPSCDSPDEPVGRMALNLALREIGYDGERFTPHSARGTAVSILSDAGWEKDVIKKQLAHESDNATDAAYFRNTLLPQRKKMLEFWSATLEGLAAGGAKIVPIGRAA